MITQVSASANAENVNNDTSSSSQGGSPASTAAAAPTGASNASSQLQTSSKGELFFVTSIDELMSTAADVESIQVHQCEVICVVAKRLCVFALER